MDEELELGTSTQWPSPRDLDDLMADREVANLQQLLKANNQTSMQQWLQVDPSQGLSNDVEKRRTTYGRNAFDAKPPTSFFEFWWDAMRETARQANFKLCFTFGCVVVWMRCFSLNTVEGTSRRSCPSFDFHTGTTARSSS